MTTLEIVLVCLLLFMVIAFVHLIVWMMRLNYRIDNIAVNVIEREGVIYVMITANNAYVLIITPEAALEYGRSLTEAGHLAMETLPKEDGK